MDPRRLPPILHRAANALAGLLYPAVCGGCGQPSDRPGSHLCWECFRTLPLGAGFCCDHCGRLTERAEEHAFLCGICRRDPPAFDRARVAGRFHGKLRHLTHKFKYRQGLWLANDLAALLHGCLIAQFDVSAIDVVVPIPLYRVRQRSRGYNQAALLAAQVARRIDRPHVPHALARTRNTGTQTRLTLAARKRNVSGAFTVSDPSWVRGRTVLLVDDVMTTGATFSAAAKVLKKAGAWQVWAVALARGQ